MDMKTKITGACRDLARERGFNNINMDALAARAGVSKRTVYRYFTGKEAIIEATLEAFMNEIALEADRLLYTEKDPALILSGLLNYLFKYGQFVINPYSFNDLRVYYPHLWEKIDRFRLERVVSVLNLINNSDDSTAANEFDPRIVSAVALASIQAVLNPDFVLANNLTFEETARQLSGLLLNGFIPR
jgi:Transcriptional regulator